MNTQFLIAVTTPCTDPTCTHVAKYGASACCEAFRAQVQAWTRTEADRLLQTLPNDCGRVWKEVWDGLHWSGGSVRLPSASIQRNAPGGWHNGCHYGGAETYPGAASTMPGFDLVVQTQ